MGEKGGEGKKVGGTVIYFTNLLLPVSTGKKGNFVSSYYHPNYIN